MSSNYYLSLHLVQRFNSGLLNGLGWDGSRKLQLKTQVKTYFFPPASAVFGRSIKKFLSRHYSRLKFKPFWMPPLGDELIVYCQLMFPVQGPVTTSHSFSGLFWSWPIYFFFFLYLSVVVPVMIKEIKRPLQSPWTEMCYFTSGHQHILCKYRLLGIGTEWLAGLKCLSWFGFDTLQAVGLQGDEVFCNQAL